MAPAAFGDTIGRGQSDQAANATAIRKSSSQDGWTKAIASERKPQMPAATRNRTLSVEVAAVAQCCAANHRCSNSMPWPSVSEFQLEGVVVVCDGHAVALVVPFDDDDLQWYARERDPAFLASLARARQQVREGKTVRHGDLKRELGRGDAGGGSD